MFLWPFRIRQRRATNACLEIIRERCEKILLNDEKIQRKIFSPQKTPASCTKHDAGAKTFQLVRLVRVELTTCRLGGGRSIQLSYNRNKAILSDNASPRKDLTEQSAL